MRKEYKGVVCRGSWDLGSACGRCERCEDTKPTTSAATIGVNKPITIDDFKKAMEEINSIPEKKDWIIVTPEGKMYVGEYEKVAPVFFAKHPLLKGLT